MSNRACWACNLPAPMREELDAALRDRLLSVAELAEWLKVHEQRIGATYDKIRHHRRNLHHYDARWST